MYTALARDAKKRISANSEVWPLRAGDMDGRIENFRMALGLGADFAPAQFRPALALRQKGNEAGAGLDFFATHPFNPHLIAPAAAGTFRPMKYHSGLAHDPAQGPTVANPAKEGI